MEVYRLSPEKSLSKADRQRADFCREWKDTSLFAKNKKFLGIIAVADTIKEDSPKGNQRASNMGIRVVQC